MRATHRVQFSNYKSSLWALRKRKRHRPSDIFKNKVCDVCVKNPGVSHSDIGLANNCTSSQISKWMKKRFGVDHWGKAKDANSPHRVEKKAKFAEAELELYDRFLYRRSVTGLYVDGVWLKVQMRKILNVLRPLGYSTFKTSNGWLWRFCSRWRITSQAKTDGKTETAENRKEKILQVIEEYRLLQRSSPQTDPVFGRFSPDRHWATDQIPISLSHPRKRSLNPKGQPCRISSVVRKALARRQATIQLTIRAQGEQIVPPVVILSGKGLRLSHEELQCMLGLEVEVYYQPKAWCDRYVLFAI